MVYFKIIQNNQIVDVGDTFFRWDAKWHQLFTCDIEYAQFAKSKKEIIYHEDWLRQCPETIFGVVEAKIVVIEKEEYDEILELLNDNNVVEIPVEEYPVEIEPDQNEAPIEKQKTITEMRETIKTQQEQIEMLTDCVLELSEILYGGEQA